MAQGKVSPRDSKTSLELADQQSSDGDSFSYSYSSYYTASEPDYIMLEIRIKQQADDLSLLQKQNRRLVDDIDLERSQGMQRLKRLEFAAKTAERRIQELSVELARSRETVKHFQELYDSQASQIQELAATREEHDDLRGAEARIQQLEAEAAQIKEEIKNGNYESTQQRAAIRKAQEERCIAQRLLEASEKERGDLAKKLAELELIDQRQERALTGAAQGWVKKNHEMDVQREELRWKMVDSKSGIVGSHHRRASGGGATAGKASAASKKKNYGTTGQKTPAAPAQADVSTSSASSSSKG